MIKQAWDFDEPKAARDVFSQSSWSKFKSLCGAAGIPQLLYHYLDKKGEPYLSGTMNMLLSAKDPHIRAFDSAVPEIISWETEFNVRRGRIDFMLYHADGSISVVELKDGSAGLQSVLAGIGQVMGYSVQIGMNNPAIKALHKVVVFSGCHSIEDDIIVMDACRAAGVIPVLFGSEKTFRRAAMDHLMGVLESGTGRSGDQHVLF